MAKKHVILIGMPGCGKSTVGALLAQRLILPFVDADEAFSHRYGSSPAECIAREGEAVFRDCETVLLKELLAQDAPMVLSCGGGIVEREENLAVLRAGGAVVYLDRPLDDLAVDGRPLSARYGVVELYRRRHGRYERAAHVCIKAKETAQATAQAVQCALEGEGYV